MGSSITGHNNGRIFSGDETCQVLLDIANRCQMIIHVDMDAFYASVEERDRPELKGKPVIVGGTADRRGVVAAANYVVRQFGVHSAMPSATAQRLCPHAVFLPCRLDYYSEVSQQIRHIFHRFTPLVEPLSLDEAFLDATGSEGLFGPAETIGHQIKDAIREEVDLIASVGVAPNKFLAKIASDLEKPDAFVVVDPDGIQEFLDPLPVERLWGVGRAASKVFQRLGVRTIRQLRQLPPDVLKSHFGNHGEHLWELAHGIDHRPVVPDREAKSISHETTFATDIDDTEALRAWLLELTEQVARRLRRHALRGWTVEIKVRFADFRTITRSRKLPDPTNSSHELCEAANELFNTRLPGGHPPVRLLGMGVHDIDRSGLTQAHLFDEGDRDKHDRIDEVGDLVRERFGTEALSRGSTLKHKAGDQPKPRQ
ncbi:MAG: DNA polymerase IV [Planctomycetota bacterium]|nr:DNA polymerase IV [Planctomycetota bacterium]